MYVVPVEKQSVGQNVFAFELGGEKFTATRFDLLPASFIEDLAEMDERRVLKALRLAIAGSSVELAEKLGELPSKAVQDLLLAWQEHARISVGESSASGN